MYKHKRGNATSNNRPSTSSPNMIPWPPMYLVFPLLRNPWQHHHPWRQGHIPCLQYHQNHVYTHPLTPPTKRMLWQPPALLHLLLPPIWILIWFLVFVFFWFYQILLYGKKAFCTTERMMVLNRPINASQLTLHQKIRARLISITLNMKHMTFRQTPLIDHHYTIPHLSPVVAIPPSLGFHPSTPLYLVLAHMPLPECYLWESLNSSKAIDISTFHWTGVVITISSPHKTSILTTPPPTPIVPWAKPMAFSWMWYHGPIIQISHNSPSCIDHHIHACPWRYLPSSLPVPTPTR